MNKSPSSARFTPRLRLTAAAVLLAAGSAIAIVGLRPEVPEKVWRLRKGGTTAELRQMAPGPKQEGAGPAAAAEEAYKHRAYPASDVPISLTKAAYEAWNNFQNLSLETMAINAATPFLQWNLIGPSVANFPAPLTFSGAPYTTSGRITALAMDTACNANTCRVWLAAAGGGVWRTNNVLEATPEWKYVSGTFATNAIGAITYTNGVLYAGTGEANSSADSEAGFGIYKSTDGGDTWTQLASAASVPEGAGVDCTAVGFAGAGVVTAPAYSGPAFDGRGIAEIQIDPTNPNTMYVASTRAARGVSSTSSGGVFTIAPGLPPIGLWKSTDGGATFTLLNYQDICLNPALPAKGGITQSSFGSSRGVRHLAIDPNTPTTVYAAPYPQNNAIPLNTKGGVWRSTDSGATWTQIKSARNAAVNTDRAAFAVTAIGGGKTRMYVGVGNTSGNGSGGPGNANNSAHVYRNDDAAIATNADFIDLSALQDASGAPNQTTNYCTSQCNYDNVVYTPPGEPDTVYVGGSYDYSTYGVQSNGRAFLRSTDAGVTFTDMTMDATDNVTPNPTCCQNNPIAPNGMHPDSHFVLEIPGTNKALFASDGGIVRSSGAFEDISAQCSTPARGFGTPLTGTNLATCQQLLKAVPSVITSLNAGLSTLQFQSVNAARDNPFKLIGGTQDNGTFIGENSPTWNQVYFGDGGNSGISKANSAFSFNTFTGKSHGANYRNGDPTRSVFISGPIAVDGTESAMFYPPIIPDPNPAVGLTIYQGSNSVWRTQDWGGQALTENNPACNLVTGNATGACGNFVKIGPAGNTQLTANAADYRGGSDRAGGNVAFLARTPNDTGTLWAATTTGRLFVSKNADNAVPAAVTFTRIDTLAPNDPNRFISSIFVDRADANRAWVTYSGYSTLTPTLPGHVFYVTYDPTAGTATWTNLDGSGAGAFPDLPALSIVSTAAGDLFASTDYNVFRLPKGSSTWEVSGTGLPMVAVSSLSLSDDGTKIYAGTHGRSAWFAEVPAAPVATTITTQASPNVQLGGTISDTATLSGGTSPTGTITFNLYGPDDATCGNASIFTSIVQVNGNASYTSASFTPNAAGTYRWIASYSGDNGNSASSGACNDPNESVDVTPLATPTPTPEPTVTPVPTATATPSATPTASPSPSPSASPSPSPTPASQAVNLSTRMRVGSGENVGIGGFIITGTAPKHVVIRGIGPSLTRFGFSDSEVLNDPYLEINGPGNFGTIVNNNWRDSQEAQLKADGLAPTNDLEAAIDATLPPGAYTAIVRANDGTPINGISLIEVYDLDTGAASRLANLSTRAFVGTGSNVVIAGFVLGGNNGDGRIVIRGLGPSLAERGVSNTLQNPTLELRDNNGTLVVSNDNWMDDPTQASEVTAAGLAPTDSRESAIAANLRPGLYTATLSGLNSTTGVGLVEVYDRGPQQ